LAEVEMSIWLKYFSNDDFTYQLKNYKENTEIFFFLKVKNTENIKAKRNKNVEQLCIAPKLVERYFPLPFSFVNTVKRYLFSYPPWHLLLPPLSLIHSTLQIHHQCLDPEFRLFLY
jgi:hypothetical protein